MTREPDQSGSRSRLHCNRQMATQIERIPFPLGDDCSQYIYWHFATIFSEFDQEKVFLRIWWSRVESWWWTKDGFGYVVSMITSEYWIYLDIIEVRLVAFRKQTAWVTQWVTGADWQRCSRHISGFTRSRTVVMLALVEIHARTQVYYACIIIYTYIYYRRVLWGRQICGLVEFSNLYSLVVEYKIKTIELLG